MKLKNLFFVCSVLALTISACVKPEDGAQGPAGKDGKDGNANIKSFVFFDPIVGGTLWYDTLPGINYQSLDSSLVLCYIKDASCSPNWYSMPGWGCNVFYAGRFYTYQANPPFDTTTTMATLELLDPDGSSVSGTYTINMLRVIVAPASSLVVGGKKEMDFSDYSATCRYLGIKE